MRLYVHFEPSDEGLAWTKRLQLSQVDESSTCPSVRSVLRCFFSAYNSKFRSETPPELENVDVFVEFYQNPSSRRLLPSLDVSIAVAGRSGTQTDANLLMSEETCGFELVVVPRKPQRKTLGPEPLPSLKTKKKCSIRREMSTNVVRDPSLCEGLELAAKYMKQRKFRAARDIYTQIVMVMDQHNPEALIALGDILVNNGRHSEAAEKYYYKCWQVHGNEDCKCKKRATLAFTSALKLATCYLVMEKFTDAEKILADVHTFVRMKNGFGDGGNKHKAVLTDADERLSMEEQIDTLKAQALYGTKKADSQEKAISLVMHLLPDLQASTLNLDALFIYAKIAHDRGKKSEALSMVLRVLVGKPNDQVVRSTLAMILKGPGCMKHLKNAVPPGPCAGAAYAFIATIVKDFGALDESIACYQQARICDPQSASYALNHAHGLEACCRYAEAFDVLVSFFRKNRTLCVGSGAAVLSAESFVKILDQIDPRVENQPIGLDQSLGNSNRWRVEWVPEHNGYAKVTCPESVQTVLLNDTVQVNTKALTALSEEELDLLACYFTIVKILFVCGRLYALPRLIRVLEPLRLGRKLHRTTIRNEQAYYACIAQLLTIERDLLLCPPVPQSEASPNPIYVCGDSHTLATAWRKIEVNGRPALLHPALVTGLKHWHLRKESTYYPKLNFWHALTRIPIKARVIFLFGEIDCREGILNAVEKCKYETVEEGMEHTIGIFMEVLADVVAKYEFDVYIHPVVPVLDETRSLVIQYNEIFRKWVDKSRICKWLDFFDELLYETPTKAMKLRPGLELDGTHLHPSYLAKLAAALSKHY